MRMDKLTRSLQAAVGEAQSLAIGRDHPFIEPLHLLKAMLDPAGSASRALLLAAGADVHAKTAIVPSRSALDVAREYGFTECARWLDGFMREDLVEIERVKLEFPKAAANFIRLPSEQAMQGRSPSPVRLA